MGARPTDELHSNEVTGDHLEVDSCSSAATLSTGSTPQHQHVSLLSSTQRSDMSMDQGLWESVGLQPMEPPPPPCQKKLSNAKRGCQLTVLS